MSNIFEKVLVPSVKTLFTVSVNTKMRKIFKEEESIELMIKKRNKVCKTLNYIKLVLILASAVTGLLRFLLLIL